MYSPIISFSPDDVRLFLSMTGWRRQPEEDCGAWEVWQWGHHTLSILTTEEDEHSNYWAWESLLAALNTVSSNQAYQVDMLINFGMALEAKEHQCSSTLEKNWRKPNMAMSKKDFEELAQLLREFYTAKYGTDHVKLQGSIEEFCARRNPRFNRPKFRRACFGPDLTPPKTL